MNVISAIALPALRALAVGVAMLGTAHAQSIYPNQPIKIVVGFVPGGSTDQVARVLADGLTTRLGKSVVVENRPGATGNMAAGQVSTAPGDGYQLYLSAVGLATTAALNPSMLKAHPVNDFMPVALLTYIPNIVLAGSKNDFKSIKEVIDYAKQNPGKVSFGHSGYGGGVHLTGELFKVRAGVNLVHVPYKGTAAVLADLLGGHVDLAFDNLSTALEQVKAGKVRALAVTTSKRVPDLPNVPTMAEAGVPGIEAGAWFGLVGPKTMPPEIARTLFTHVQAVLDDPKTNERFKALGILPLKSNSPSDYSKYVTEDIARWKEIIDKGNLKPE